MTIINLPYSFMQFEPISHADYILPIFQEDDVHFALLVRCENFEEAQDIYFGASDEMQLVLLRGFDNNPASFAPQTLRNYTIDDSLLFEKTKISNTDVLFVWKHGFKKVIQNNPVIACNECFQAGIIFKGHKLVSNAIRKVCDDTDTSLLEYSSDDDSFQFYYCKTTLKNRVRVPMIFRQPQISTTESIYVRSDGSRKVTKSVKTKEFNAMIDFAFISLHEKIDIALSHDHVYVESRSYRGNVIKTGNYDINWEESLNADFAQAECKVIVTPFNARNSNCATCEDCTPVNIDIAIPTVYYSEAPMVINLPIEGSAPFVITNINKPAWVDEVEVLGPNVRITGLTPAPGQTSSISFKLYNCFGANSYLFSGSIAVATIPPVVISSTTSNSTAITIDWDEVANADYYEVGIRPFPSSDNFMIQEWDAGTRTWTNFDDLDPVTSYELGVRVFIGSFSSEWSTVVKSTE